MLFSSERRPATSMGERDGFPMTHKSVHSVTAILLLHLQCYCYCYCYWQLWIITLHLWNSQLLLLLSATGATSLKVLLSWYWQQSLMQSCNFFCHLLDRWAANPLFYPLWIMMPRLALAPAASSKHWSHMASLHSPTLKTFFLHFMISTARTPSAHCRNN